MKILSLDQSLSCSGYSIFENEKLLSYGTLHTKKQTFQEKVFDISSQIETLIKVHHVDLVLVETTFNHGNSETFRKLSILEGVILKTSHYFNVPIIEIAPSQWRTYLTRNVRLPYHNSKRLKRNELKEMSKMLVKNKFGIDVNDDISDSITMALYYLDKQKDGDTK